MPLITQRWLPRRLRMRVTPASMTEARCLSLASSSTFFLVSLRSSILRAVALRDSCNPSPALTISRASGSWLPGWRWCNRTAGRSRRSRVVRSEYDAGPYKTMERNFKDDKVEAVIFNDGSYGQPFVGLQCKWILPYTGSVSRYIDPFSFPPLLLPLRLTEIVWRPTLRSHAKITPAFLTSVEANVALICPPSDNTLLYEYLMLKLRRLGNT